MQLVHYQLKEKSLTDAFLVREADGVSVAKREAVVKAENQREFSCSCTHVQVFRVKLTMPVRGLRPRFHALSRQRTRGSDGWTWYTGDARPAPEEHTRGVRDAKRHALRLPWGAPL